MPVVIVGSIALDHVKTPMEEHSNLLGGSTSYASIAAAYYAPVQLVGIVGTDFPKQHVELFQSRSIDLAGLQIVEGKTFRWAGEYFWDLNTRKTLSVELNVFEHFKPALPDSYLNTPYALLGNIAPEVQLQVLEQLKQPKFVVADTMDIWIENTKEALLRLISRVDMLILNDAEARQLTGQTSLIKAGNQICGMGPKYVAIKKGEHGCLLFGKQPGEFFSCGAYPLEDIHDPTGAGDTFAGGLVGYLASSESELTFEKLKKAVVVGTVLASYNVEAFSMNRMQSLTRADVDARWAQFKRMSHFGDLP